MIIWIKFAHSNHFSSLIPKMLMFTLAISCLTISNLNWFKDLTFHIPIKYFSLQHRNSFHHQSHPHLDIVFALAPFLNFFLVLICHSFSVPYWAPINWGVNLSVSHLFAFSFCSWHSQDKNTEVFTILFSSRPPLFRTLHHDPSIMGGPIWHGSYFHWIRKGYGPLCDEFD